MGLLVEVARQATTAWSPTGPMLAAATKSGAIDASFETGATLEIFSIDFRRARMQVASAVQCSERFCRIAWGGPDKDSLIAGGLQDGSVRVWDARMLLRTKAGAEPNQPVEESTGVVLGGPSSKKRHTASVRGLEFNSFNTSLLASGSLDSEIVVWDLGNKEGSKVHLLSINPEGQNPGLSQGEVTALAWNPNLEPILATTLSIGATWIWDLRKKKPVTRILDPRGRTRCSALAWNPAAVTQLLIATDDESAKSSLLWDMRNLSAPLREYGHHQAGVIAVSWSAFDPDFILTTAKDNRTCVVSAETTHVVCEIPRVSNWSFDVEWSSSLPGVFSSSSYDGRLSIHGLLCSSSALYSTVSSTASALASSFNIEPGEITATSPRLSSTNVLDLTKPPKWIIPPVSVSFGFGGIISHAAKNTMERVTVARCSTEPKIVHQGQQFQSILDSCNVDELKEYCQVLAREDSSMSSLAWSIVKLQFESDARRKLLSLLGHSPSEKGTSSDSIGLISSSPLASLFLFDESSRPPTICASENLGLDSAVAPMESESPAIDLSGPAPWDAQESIPQDSSLDNVEDDLNLSMTHVDGTIEKKVKPISLGRDAVREAVMVGDFSTAVEAALRDGDHADALMLAHCGGPSLWMQTQKQILEAHRIDFMRDIFRALVVPSVEPGSESSLRESWKERLVAAATFEEGERLREKCDALGANLLDIGEEDAALCCFLCSLNVNMASAIWLRQALPRRVQDKSTKLNSNYQLFSLVRKIKIVAAAAAAARGESVFSKARIDNGVASSLLMEFSSVLAEEGRIDVALRYLEGLRPESLSRLGTVEELSYRFGTLLSISQPIPANPRGTNPVMHAQSYLPPTSFQEQQTYPPPKAVNHMDMPSFSTVVPPTQMDQFLLPKRVDQVPPPMANVPLPVLSSAPGTHFSPPPQRPQPGPPVIQNHLIQASSPSTFSPAPSAQFNPPVTRIPQDPKPAPIPEIPLPKMMVPGPPSGAQPPVVMPPKTAMRRVEPPSAEVAGILSARVKAPVTSTFVTIMDVDVKGVAPEDRVIVTVLRKCYEDTCAMSHSPNFRKKMDDVSRRLGRLLERLNTKALTPPFIERLHRLCDAISNSAWVDAKLMITSMIKEHYDDHQTEIMGLRYLLDSAMTGR
uniref:Uncharacterized protein n=1 Tax=Compsopogon caeruleus TaxID=31354 RepID=A0A7S1XF25_9RHOD|mmetsp:Transcript_2338/g.4016  ORF Transcript_2338/g.4016 Transcript_2338/m.4016 type:complete len:1148 (+) Transcript_2338:254-3697(+)|eukprot:CAMPEP_0184683656 /NCGR_PEP_ID=MMETSP0312-20130426/12050_1 /TAXON_ID=31354 /ORGANISM="Compsopogon coeruleus, Strain SAG 36.94" /LENGTH=1147 /DNA_ID=CAMNT_0027136141 /DNA_START=162 /DNA_END=3605 /DNA_ORIENTATION=+